MRQFVQAILYGLVHKKNVYVHSTRLISTEIVYYAQINNYLIQLPKDVNQFVKSDLPLMQEFKNVEDNAVFLKPILTTYQLVYVQSDIN